jgi:hypothetical protein
MKIDQQDFRVMRLEPSFGPEKLFIVCAGVVAAMPGLFFMTTFLQPRARPRRKFEAAISGQALCVLPQACSF